jgi:hypothetical protein
MGEVLNRQRWRCLRILKICTLNLASRLASLLYVNSSPRGTKPVDIQALLMKQDSYTLHRLVRQRLPRNPYDVTNIMDVWECDLMEVQNFSKYNDR